MRELEGAFAPAAKTAVLKEVFVQAGVIKLDPPYGLLAPWPPRMFLTQQGKADLKSGIAMGQG